MLGLVGLKPSAGAYCASKGAVVLLTKQIAVEYGVDKIHCNALCPGCKSKTPFVFGSTQIFFESLCYAKHGADFEWQKQAM